MRNLNNVCASIILTVFLASTIFFDSGIVSATTCDQSIVVPIHAKAGNLIESAQYDEAIPLYKELIQRCPQKSQAYMDYGSVLFASASQYFHRFAEPMFEQTAIPILEEAAINLKKAISLYGDGKQSNFYKAHAYYLLGDIYQYGLADLNEAENMYQKSLLINSDNDIVQRELEYIKKELKYIENTVQDRFPPQTIDSITDLTALRQDAENGSAEAQNNLGQIYVQGKKVSQDFQEAVKWFQKAADQGLARAQLALGLMYGQGLGVTENETESMRLIRKAADQGFMPAMQVLSQIEDRQKNEVSPK